MSRDPHAKHRKALARKKKLKQERIRSTPPECPPLVVAANDSEAGFADLVRRAAAEFDFRDLDDWTREVYGAIARKGLGHARLLVEATATAAGQQYLAVWHQYTQTLDNHLYARVLNGGGAKYLPMHELQTVPQDGRVLVNLRSLRRAKGPGGTAYHSSHRPTVKVGRDLIVAFSYHALERAADRATPTWRRSVGGLTDAFGLFEYCLEFEPWTQEGGGVGFVLWENCRAGYLSGRLARTVLGGAYSEGEKYRYRVGYCPAVVEGDFLKATTLLFPGYGGTPEQALLRRHPMPAADRQRLTLEARGMDMAAIQRGEGMDLIRWFHDHGVPQVREGRVRFAPVPLQELTPRVAGLTITPREAERIEEFGRTHAAEVVRAAVATGSYQRPGGTEDADAPPRRRFTLGSNPAAWARSAVLGRPDSD